MIEDVLEELVDVNSKEVNKTTLFASLKNIESHILLLQDAAQIAAKIRECIPEGIRISFVSGNFNIVHTGHIRLLNFAKECADFLVVALNHDSKAGTLIPQPLRLESVRALGCVDLVLPLSATVATEELITHLKPDTVVKGAEYEKHFNSEQAIVETYGGKLLFSSGEMQFSSVDLLRSEINEIIPATIKKPHDYLKRHGIDEKKIAGVVQRFTELSVVVIGDLIVDEYITCDALGISREDPTIVVTPIKKDVFVGGAGIVAAHAKALGARVRYLTVTGNDEIAAFASKTLKKYDVDAFFVKDDSRPTTLKQRFRADNKTMLRVSHLRHHHISSEVADKLLDKLTKMLKHTDMVIFSDFNYGCLPQTLVDHIISLCHKQGIPMVADSQSSSQMGDISRYQGMLLITPTEYEARLAIRDQSSGLLMLADSLRQKTHTEHVLITMGADGLLIYSPNSVKNEINTDQLPAFNTSPKDVSGGGDCLLICTSLALAAGATIWEAAYVGSLAAACHVSRMGNLPLSFHEVLKELQA